MNSIYLCQQRKWFIRVYTWRILKILKPWFTSLGDDIQEGCCLEPEKKKETCFPLLQLHLFGCICIFVQLLIVQLHLLGLNLEVSLNHVLLNGRQPPTYLVLLNHPKVHLPRERLQPKAGRRRFPPHSPSQSPVAAVGVLPCFKMEIYVQLFGTGGCERITYIQKLCMYIYIY